MILDDSNMNEVRALYRGRSVEEASVRAELAEALARVRELWTRYDELRAAGDERATAQGTWGNYQDDAAMDAELQG